MSAAWVNIAHAWHAGYGKGMSDATHTLLDVGLKRDFMEGCERETAAMLFAVASNRIVTRYGGEVMAATNEDGVLGALDRMGLTIVDAYGKGRYGVRYDLDPEQARELRAAMEVAAAAFDLAYRIRADRRDRERGTA